MTRSEVAGVLIVAGALLGLGIVTKAPLVFLFLLGVLIVFQVVRLATDDFEDEDK